MTEEEIISLGFEKQIEESGKPFYYYTLDMPGGISFITEANDDIQNNDWSVEIFFDCNPKIKFKEIKKLSELINIINKNINN